MSQRFIVRSAIENDSDKLTSIFKDIPQEGRIQLIFEREPDYLVSSKTTSTEPEIWIVEDLSKDCFAGIFSMGKRLIYVDGEKKTIRYVSDLRINKDYQGGRTLLRIGKHYQKIIGEEWCQTVILDGNDKSLTTVGGGRLIFPTYHPAGRHQTNLIELKKNHKKPDRYSIRNATQNDVDIMQAFFEREAPNKQFYPYYKLSEIGSNNPYYFNIKLSDFFLAFENDELVGMAGLWDQKCFKQTKISAYTGGMQFIRPIYNLYTKLFGGLLLPPPGSDTKYINLHTILCKDNQIDIFADLIKVIRSHYRYSDYDALVFGFDINDPLNKIASKYKGTKLFSQHFLMSYGENPHFRLDQNKLNYLETARL